MEAGTKIKNLIGRLVTAEATAKNLFNEALKLNSVMADDGKLFTYDDLSALAKKDLPMAIQKVSELRKEGVLTDAVISKLFTNRHGLDLANLLDQINGNVENFTNSLATGLNYIDDTAKNMFNINNQLQQLQNNSLALLSTQMGTLNEISTGGLMTVNDLMKGMSDSMSKMPKELSSTLNVLTTSILTAGAGITSIVAVSNLLKPLFLGASGALGLWLIPVSAVVAGMSFLIKQSYEIRKAYIDVGLTLSSIPKQIQNSITETDVLNSKIQKTRDLLKEASNPELKGMDNFSIIMDNIIEKSKVLKGYLDASANWDFSYNFKQASGELEKVSEQLNGIRDKEEQYQQLYTRYKDSILSFALFDEKDKPKRELTWLEKMLGSKQESTRAEVLELYFKYREQNIPLEKISEKISSELNGISQNDVRIIIGGIDVGTLDKIKESLADIKKQKGDLEIQQKNISDEASKQAQSNMEAFNKLKALLSDTSYNELIKTGSTKIEGELISGLSGAMKLTDKYLLADYQNALQAREEELGKLRDSIINTTDIAKEQNRELTDNEREYIKTTKDRIALLEKQKANINGLMDSVKNNSGSIAKELEKLFAGIDITAQNFETIMKVARLLINRDFLKDSNAKQMVQEVIDSEVRQVKYLDKQQKERQANHTKYQLKHISYLKENLQLELEIAKIGASKEKQAYLEYEYKLKTLEANKQLAQQEAKSVKDMVLSYKAESSVGKSYLSKALSAGSASEVQRLLNQFESQYAGIMIGDKGKRIKSDYDQIVKLMKAMKQVEDSSRKFSISMKEGLVSIQDVMTSSIFEILSEKSAEFRTQYLDSLLKEFQEQKKKIAQDFGMKQDFNLQEELLQSSKKIDLLKMIGADTSKLEEFKDVFISLFGEEVYKKSLESEELRVLLFSREENLMKALVDLEKQRLEYNNKNTDAIIKQMEYISSMSSLFSKMGSVFGVEIFGQLGDVLGAFKEAESHMADPNNNFSVSGIFNPKEFSKELENGMKEIDWTAFTDNLGKAFENMTKQMSQGNMIGTLVGSITGGGRSSQQAGVLAGLVTGATGIGGWTGAGIQIGASLLGGLFDKGEKDQAEAEKRTKEANKIYNKNTEALQKLSQNMANLNGGVDGLSSSLISSFSKIPTVGNLNRVTDAMSQLYKTMDKTRIFNEVAYQVTKTKKGKKGFLGIGATDGSSWTETIKLSVQEMLNRYGFKGTIHDMSTQQIRDFSKWLKDYDLGDSDNFSVLAEALENYAEALDKFDKNIDNFFRDTTMEAFEGISSLQQEELRQQIEDFYKNLGLQIDDETSKEIDKLAEQMSIMVTIMQDVRGNFINSWKDSGVDAGRAFITSMTPYVDAMLSNISQIFYDVYFSDVNKQLEDEFKALSEKLVELKKKGGELDWKNVANELSGSFEKVIAVINSTKNETESFNTILFQLQKQAMEAGLSLSEIFDLGLVTGTQKSVIDAFKEALTSGEADSGFKAIGNMVGDKVGQAMVNKMIDSMMGEKIFEMSAQLDKVLSGGNLNFDSLAGLANDAMSVGSMLEQQRLRFEAIKDMFNWDSDITYENQNSNIEYQSGVSSQNVYNVYVNGTVEAGTVVESDSVERLLDAITDSLIDKLRVDKGIDLRKLQ